MIRSRRKHVYAAKARMRIRAFFFENKMRVGSGFFYLLDFFLIHSIILKLIQFFCKCREEKARLLRSARHMFYGGNFM